MCPQCNAPLSPHRFARSFVCSYCGATVQLDETSLSAERFHEALRLWNAPESYGFSSWVSISDRHWALEKRLAQGELSDIYAGRLARWPTELVILKILRDRQNAGLFDNEWDALQKLHQSNAPGADTFTSLLPQPVVHGDLTSGSFSGQRVSIFRWAPGFRYTFTDVIRAYPQGIPPRASIWVWRRILEVLSFIHTSGMAHGAVLPDHLLIQDNDHGVRLVGYSRAGRLGEELLETPAGCEAFYPRPTGRRPVLTAQLDLAMSARCVAALLGGSPETGALPSAVPARLADKIRHTVLPEHAGAADFDAWALREELGELAKEIFGPSQFIPVVMPG